MKSYDIAILKGDGIGPEVVEQAVKVLDAAQEKHGFRLNYNIGEAGASCIEKYGTNLPEKTIELLNKTQACLKGPMTTFEDPNSPPSASVAIRKKFNLYANVRPCRSLPNVHPLKENVDFVIVRENTEGLYSGVEKKIKGGAVAYRIITKKACERIARFSFRLAMRRKNHLTLVHKANILRLTDGVFKKAVEDVGRNFPKVNVDDYHIDNMAMQILKRPEHFDVIVTSNLFGDILTDEGAHIVGGLGLVPSANIGDTYAMFEAAHGTVPKYAGKNKANPIAIILAGKMMLEYLGESKAADAIQDAVKKVLVEGRIRTHDIGGSSGTNEVGSAIVEKI